MEEKCTLQTDLFFELGEELYNNIQSHKEFSIQNLFLILIASGLSPSVLPCLSFLIDFCGVSLLSSKTKAYIQLYVKLQKISLLPLSVLEDLLHVYLQCRRIAPSVR